MEMKIPLVAISAFVVVVVLGAVLMPILDDATDTHDDFTNVGYFNLKMDAVDSIDLEWDYTNPSKITINSVEYSFTGVPSDITILCTDNGFIRFQVGSRITFIDSNGTYAGGVSTSKNFSFIGANGSATITYGTDTVDVTYSDLYVMSNDGEYIMKKSTDTVYLLKDTPILLAGRSTIGTSQSEFLMGTGSVEDGVTFTTVNGSENTFGDVEIAATPVNGYVDLYQVGNITVTATNSTGSSDLTYSYYIVPAEVTAEKAAHLDGNETAILAAIPALVIVALLIGVIALFVRSKMD